MDTNDDLIIEILINLPVKSLLRFRSVCKSWCNIIDSSAFRKFHLQNQSRNNINDDDDILFLQFCREGHKWELSSTLFMDNWKLGKAFPPPFHEFLKLNFWEDLVVDGPINGLICMYDKYLYNNKRCISIAICNPCLGETRILPASLACSSSVFDYRRHLSYATRIIGFGFDSVRKDYKVVQIIWSGDGNSYVEVYSGRTNTWRLLDTDIIEDDKPLNTNSQIKTTCKGSGGVTFWRIDQCYDIILSFDMQNEVFEMIRLPDVAMDKVMDLQAKDDDLLLLFVYTADRTKMEVWELEINAKERGWCHVRNVNLRQFLGARTVALWKYGVVLTSYFRDESRTKDKEFIFYDYSTQKERKRVEFSTYIRDRELLVEYKCTFNSLEMCLNSAGMES